MNVKQLFKYVLVWAALLGVLPATAAWKDVKIDLNSLLTSEEMVQGTALSFGLVVADDGTTSRVAADDATANAVVSGNYHSDHGWTNSKMVVAVEGAVKVGIGNCTYGNHNASVSAANGTTVAITTQATCYKNDQSASYGYYTGEATTLTISGADYNRYFSVESVVADYMVTYYNEAYTSADASYTVLVQIPMAKDETVTLVSQTPSAPAGKKFAGWALADGTAIVGGEAAADMAVYPVWEDAALSVGETAAVVKPEHVYTAVKCVTKGDNQLIDSSYDGAYILFDVLPEVSGVYSFTSMVGTTLDEKAVTVGIVDANGEYTVSEKKDITNSGNWNSGSNYTWNLELVAGQVYTIKVTCHAPTGGYCVNVFEMTVKKEADLQPTGFRNFEVDLKGQGLLTADEYSNRTNTSFGVRVSEDGSLSRVAADSDLATFVLNGKYHNDHGWLSFSAVVPVEGSVKITLGTCQYGGGDVVVTNAAGETVLTMNTNDGTCDTKVSAVYEGEATTLTIKSSNYTPYFAVEAVENEGGDDDVTTWRDIKIDLTNGQMITSEETSITTIGVAIAEDGTATRVAADDATANIVVSGKFHSNEHGLGNFSCTVAVEGPVKIGMGSCAWGGDVTIKNAAGETVGTFNTNNGACYHNDKENNIVYGYYNGEATTLTISGGSYTPYISVEKVEEVMEEATVTFDLGGVAAEGVVPAAVKVIVGTETVTVPANFTLYVEGKTLTGWTDGTTTYAIGAEIAPTADMTLTPVFTDNTVALADRKEAVTVKWSFRRDEGAPTVGWEGQSGLIWVAQAVVNGETIDVKMDFSTSPGKMANGNWNDWCQLNGGTTFTLPSCKGAVVSMEAYSAPTTTTIDGQTDYTANGNTISYTIANTAETIDVVIGDGSYYRYIQVVLPYVEKSYAGTVFENAEASAIWAFTSSATEAAVTSPDGAFSMNSVTTGSFTVSTGSARNINYVTVMPADATDCTVTWNVKPAKGLTFTPTKVSAKVCRFGTDGGTLDVIARTGDGQEVTLETGLIPLRNNKTMEAGDDKHAGDAKLCEEFELEVPATLASTEGFSLVVKVSSLDSNKSVGFSDVRIYGTVNGTVADVAKYALTAVGNIAEAGTVTVYPASDKYDDGTEITLTAAENFGYDFVNWTNAAGEEVSTESKFVYEVVADDALTANFVKVNTYELAMTIEGGANDYMVSYNPAPTIVDGKQMYEEGTIVGIAAASNPILTFANWNTGETNPTLSVTMNADYSFTATYAAANYIVGWDFIKKGGSGRPADFASTVDNETAVLYMTNADGDVQGWLDKSKEAAGGYESFEGAAVNWKKLGVYWYEFKLNASEFTNIRVDAELMYNYNAYTTVIVEYSVDGTTWTEAGRVTMAGAKTENPVSATLGEDANNAASLLVRFRPDTNGAVDGSSAPDNDGTTISNIYVYGDVKLVDDGQDPTIVSTIPANGATGASATGKIVLNFHEKVALQNTKATLGDKEVEGVVSGKTVTFSYMGLEYNKEYTFTLAANSVYDLTGNACKDDIVIKFTTIAPPTVTPGQYDAVVTNAEELLAAMKKADGANRFRIFLYDGVYDLGTACLTTVPGYVSLIGESMENTIIVNDPQAEGISVTATLCTGGENIYMQDLTLKSVDYDRGANNSMGRCVALQENASKAVYKNVRLLSNQDTYYTRATKRTYWEGGMITGTVDYLCGGGDVFFNGVTLYNNARSNGDCITAPATSSDWGYVFSNCTIDGDAGQDGNYSLGRPWQGSPRAVYINTTMKIVPSAGGWSDMGAVPALFAEYNSHTESGALVDCSTRKTSFKSNGVDVKVSYNPVLTAEEAAKFTVENVLAGDDGWQPRLLTEQALTPEVSVESGLLKWNASEYVFCYAICKNGKIVEFTNENSWAIPADATDEDYYSVRAANNMGGLCAASVALNKNGVTGIAGIVAEGEVVNIEIFTLDGVKVSALRKGINIVRTTYANGVVTVEKKVEK